MSSGILGVLFIILIFIAFFLTRGAVLVLGLMYGVVMFLLIYGFGVKVGKILLKGEFALFKTSKKLNKKACILYDEKYRKKYSGIKGYLNISIKITWMGLSIGLLALRTVISDFRRIVEMRPTEAPIGEVVVLSMTAIILATLVSLLAPTYLAIDSSRIRIIKIESGDIVLPGSFLRSIFKSAFGAGNVASIAYFTYESIKVVNDVVLGFKIALLALSIVYGSISIAAIIASALIIKGTKTINKILLIYEELYLEESLSKDEFINLMEQYLPPTD